MNKRVSKTKAVSARKQMHLDIHKFDVTREADVLASQIKRFLDLNQDHLKGSTELTLSLKESRRLLKHLSQ